MKKVDLIDHEKLQAAIADYSDAVANTKSHHAELEILRSQIGILDLEINHLALELKGINANRATSIADIKSAAHRKVEAERELETLRTVQTGLKRQLPSLDRDYNLSDILNESESKRYCWRIVYDGLLKAIDVDALKQLVAVCVASGLSERTAISDLGLFDVEYARLEPIAKQYGLPV